MNGLRAVPNVAKSGCKPAGGIQSRRKHQRRLNMKSLIIAGTVISNREQALNLVKRLNKYFETDKSIEMALALDHYAEQLINAGFITWDDVE